MMTFGDLTFHRPDDAQAMRLLRALYAVGASPDSQAAHAAFWGALAGLCLTHPQARALCERLDGDARALKRVIEALTRLPAGALGW
jgi:hypothetical protein